MLFLLKAFHLNAFKEGLQHNGILPQQQAQKGNKLKSSNQKVRNAGAMQWKSKARQDREPDHNVESEKETSLKNTRTKESGFIHGTLQ